MNGLRPSAAFVVGPRGGWPERHVPLREEARPTGLQRHVRAGNKGALTRYRLGVMPTVLSGGRAGPPPEPPPI